MVAAGVTQIDVFGGVMAVIAWLAAHGMYHRKARPVPVPAAVEA